jgi:YgiT-type zinc finger domain-containing protein
MIEITICPVCAGKVKKIKEDWVGKVNGQTYIVPDLEYYICAECGERIYPREALKKIELFSPVYQMAEPV